MSLAITNEARIQTTAREIFAATRQEKPSLLSSERWQGEMMEWAMADERLKVEMLRFVDVFPTLRSRSEIGRHLREYFARQGVAAPKVLRWGISLAGEHSPVAPLASGVIMWTIVRHYMKSGGDTSGAFVLSIHKRMRVVVTASIVWISVGAIPRILTFTKFELFNAAEKKHLPGLITKHALSFTVIVCGAVLWIHLNRKIKSIPATTAEGADY